MRGKERERRGRERERGDACMEKLLPDVSEEEREREKKEGEKRERREGDRERGAACIHGYMAGL